MGSPEQPNKHPYSRRYSFKSTGRGPTLLERYRAMKWRHHERLEAIKDTIPANLRYYRLGAMPKLVLLSAAVFYLTVRILRTEWAQHRIVELTDLRPGNQQQHNGLVQLLPDIIIKIQMIAQTTDSNHSPLVLGYWGLRFRGQIPRLLCEQFKVPYVNKIYRCPGQWEHQKNTQQFRSWTFIDLPYVIDGNDHVTEMLPCIQYIAKKYGPRDFLGRTIEEQAQVEMFLWTIDSLFRQVIRLGCPSQGNFDAEGEKKRVWNLLKEKMPPLERFQKIDHWYMGYLTACDFCIYEMMPYLALFFPCAAEKCSRLREISENVGKLELIAAYEASDRAIRCRLPREAWQQYANQQQRGQHHPCKQ